MSASLSIRCDSVVELSKFGSCLDAFIVSEWMDHSSGPYVPLGSHREITVVEQPPVVTTSRSLNEGLPRDPRPAHSEFIYQRLA